MSSSVSSSGFGATVDDAAAAVDAEVAVVAVEVVGAGVLEGARPAGPNTTVTTAPPQY